MNNPSALSEGLASALMEQRDALNVVLGTMHRTHLRLMEVLNRMESRLESLEARGETSKDEFASWMTDNIGEIAASLTKIDDFNNHIEGLAEEVAEENFRSNIRSVTVSVDNINISLDV